MLTHDWLHKSIKAGDISAQNIESAKMPTNLQRQETLEELADFKRLDIHAEGRSDHLLHTHQANLSPNNPENPRVNQSSMDNASFLTSNETGCVQKGEHNNCFKYFSHACLIELTPLGLSIQSIPEIKFLSRLIQQVGQMHSGGYRLLLSTRAGTATHHAKKSANSTQLGLQRWTEVQ